MLQRSILFIETRIAKNQIKIFIIMYILLICLYISIIINCV